MGTDTWVWVPVPMTRDDVSLILCDGATFTISNNSADYYLVASALEIHGGGAIAPVN